MEKREINKVGLFYIKEKKLFTVYKSSINQYITPGGKIEKGETDKKCLEREIKEELGCKVKNIVYFKSFTRNSEKMLLKMKCYFGKLEGKITPQNEIQSYKWIDKNYKGKIPLGPMLKEQIIPALVEKRLL